MTSHRGNNHSQSSWYVHRRKSIMPIFETGKHLREMTKKYSSTTGKYLIEIYPIVFRRGKGHAAFTHARVLGPENEVITEVFRNDEKFPFYFVENHVDGHDYILCSEDTQTHGAIRLDTGERTDFVSEKTKRDMEFSWRKFHLSPCGTRIAIEGTCKRKHDELSEYSEIRFYSFDDPMDLPYEEIGERYIGPYDEVLGWDGEGIIFSTHEEMRRSDEKPYYDLTREEVIVALEQNDLHSRRVIYNLEPNGNKTELFSEWVAK